MEIKNFKSYLVEAEREVFFTFGRMNPPTIGHGKVIDTIVQKAGGADYKIFVSQTTGPKDPLSYSDKIKTLRKMFPKHGRNIIADKKIRNVFDIAAKLYDMGYKKITMVVGQDRLREFEVLLGKYNGKKAKHGFYNFESINVVSAGQRDPDAEGVEGMSASKQRASAKDNDYAAFAQGVPKGFSDKDTRTLFNKVRAGLGIKEERSFKRHIDLGKKDDTREAYVSGDLFEIGDDVVIKESGEVGIVSMLGANYVIVEINEKRYRKWLDDVELVEKKTRQDTEIGKDVKGTQPAKYYAKDAEGDDMAKSTKKKRAAHFKRGASKDDDDPSAYKPAPGDKGAETKPSKYTKAFKKMFDENVDEKIGSTGAFGTKSATGVLSPALDKALDKIVNKKKYQKAVRLYLDWRRKNPKAGESGAYDFLRHDLGVESPRQVLKYMNQMIKKGLLPKHLELKAETDPEIVKIRTDYKDDKEDLKKQYRATLDKARDARRLARAQQKNRETRP